MFGAESDDETANELVKAIETPTIHPNTNTKTEPLKVLPEKQPNATTTKALSKPKDEKQKSANDKKSDDKKLSISGRAKGSTSITSKEKNEKISNEHKKLKKQSPVHIISVEARPTTSDNTAYHRQQSSAHLKRAANEEHQKSSEPLAKKRKSAPQKNEAETKKKTKRHQEEEGL